MCSTWARDALQASPQRSARSGSVGAGGSGGGAAAEFAAAHETATSAHELSGLRPGGTDSSPDIGGQPKQGAVSAPPYNPFSVSMRRMRAAAADHQHQQQHQHQPAVDPGAAAAYAPVSQAQLTPLWATRGELRQKQHGQHPGRQQRQPPPQQQQQPGGQPVAAHPAAGGAAPAPAQLDDLRPSLRDAIHSLDSALSHDDPNPPPPQARRQSLCTATAQQLRM